MSPAWAIEHASLVLLVRSASVLRVASSVLMRPSW